MQVAQILKTYKTALIWSAIVFVVDGLLAGVIALSLWVLLINIVFRVPYNLILGLFKKQFQAETLKRCALLIVCASITVAYCLWLDNVAVSRANMVVEALEKYKESSGKYPDKLEDLVPKYLAELPTLKPGFSNQKLKYAMTGGGPVMYFGPSPVAIPVPKMYDFQKKFWESRD
jgi:hypothetical protein